VVLAGSTQYSKQESITMTESTTLDFSSRYGPWAVIAGASDGTGLAFAEYVAARGVNVVLVARRAALLEEVAGKLQRDYGVACRTLVVDLSAEGAATAMLDGTRDLDVGLYISNAGVVTTNHGFLDADVAESLGAVRLNVATLVEAVHGFGSRLRERGRGGIIIMSSLAALGGRPMFTMYASTKAFGAVFAESMWAELRDENIDVIGAIAPGMDTPTARRKRGSDERHPSHQSAEDVVARTFDMFGREALVYFPLAAEVDRYEAIREDRRSSLLTATEWVTNYKKEVALASQSAS
jgi:uncharacterized protein